MLSLELLPWVGEVGGVLGESCKSLGTPHYGEGAPQWLAFTRKLGRAEPPLGIVSLRTPLLGPPPPPSKKVWKRREGLLLRGLVFLNRGWGSSFHLQSPSGSVPGTLLPLCPRDFLQSSGPGRVNGMDLHPWTSSEQEGPCA